MGDEALCLKFKCRNQRDATSPSDVLMSASIQDIHSNAVNHSDAYCYFVAIETQHCTVVVVREGAAPVICWLDVWGAG